MYRNEKEYLYMNAFSTANIVEKTKYKLTGEKADISKDWYVLLPLGIMLMLVTLLIQGSDDCIVYFVKLPLFALGALATIAFIACCIRSGERNKRQYESERARAEAIKVADLIADYERKNRMNVKRMGW